MRGQFQLAMEAYYGYGNYISGIIQPIATTVQHLLLRLLWALDNGRNKASGVLVETIGSYWWHKR